MVKTKVTNFSNVKLIDKVALEPGKSFQSQHSVDGNPKELKQPFPPQTLSVFFFLVTHIHSTAL